MITVGRSNRIEVKNGIYHVISRGNNREYIFKEAIDKGYFIKTVKEAVDGLCVNVYGYVLMDNHYHLLLQTFDKKLQDIMHQVNNKYSKYFNYKYKRVGHVFQGRYKSIIVQDERYLLSVVRYIHRNPISAGICSKVDDYRWSSDIYYRKALKGFINIDIILRMLAENRNDAVEKYAEFMKYDSETEDHCETTDIIGEEAYEIMLTPRKQQPNRKRLDEILIDTGVSNTEYEQIKKGARSRNLVHYKYLYIKQAVELKYTYKEIGTNISISDAAVKNILNKYLISNT